MDPSYFTLFLQSCAHSLHTLKVSFDSLEPLKAIAGAAPKLKLLQVSYFDAEIVSIVESFPRLKVLHISNPANMKDFRCLGEISKEIEIRILGVN